MLLQLCIRNLALIQEMELEFHPGLNVLTGETGAGKSIVVDAVNLVLGERATREMIAANKEKARVEAVFDLADNEQVAALLHEMQVDDGDDGLVSISRELTDTGRNLCRINGTLVPLQTLKMVSAQLLDIHGQHEHQLLLDRRNHILYLDAYGAEEVTKLKDKVSKLYNNWNDVYRKLEYLRKSISEREQRIDMLRFQKEELEGASLHEGETEELESKRSFYRNADKIMSAFAEACSWLAEGTDEGGSACDLMRNGISALASVSDLDEQYNSLYTRLNELYYEMEDTVEELKDLRDKMDFDREEADRIENRIDQLHRLGRKYGTTTTEMLQYLKKVQTELSTLQNSEEETEALEMQELKLREELTAAASELTAARKKAAECFEKDMECQLKDLGMKNARISVAFHEAQNTVIHLTETGKDFIEFLFSANLGREIQPLAKIASGGELSRIMLALKNLSAKKPGVPRSMVFDEIDTGISGRMAQVVAEKMCEIGDHHQVICVTHLPQIAAMADEQYLVSKVEREGQTYTEIKHLSREQRTEELARMIGGAAGGTSALGHASHMLTEADDRKRELRNLLRS